MEKSKIKKYATITILIAVSALLSMCFYPFPKEIHAEYQALKYIENDPSSVETITVKIEGTLNQPIFKQHSFEGNIEIEGYDFTKKDTAPMRLFISKRENGVYWGTMLYMKDTSSLELVEPFSIFANENFDKASIVTSHLWDGNDPDKRNTFIVVGATNYDEAVKLHNSLGDALGFNFSQVED